MRYLNSIESIEVYLKKLFKQNELPQVTSKKN